MKTLIKLKIEKFIEKEEEYFVATSDDLEGLVAEGKTIEEVIEIAQILLELDKETNFNSSILKNIPIISQKTSLLKYQVSDY